MNFKRWSLVLPVFVFFTTCGPVPLQRLGGYQCIPCTDEAAPAPGASGAGVLAGTAWLYQLQDASPAEIDATGFDIVVIDYSRTGTEDGRYSGAEMTTMKTGRTVLAYLSIGEAENYRYYFEESWTTPFGGQPGASAPCWLARTNPDWEGNYKVQFWSERWQIIVLNYLDKIIDDGFDGIYLDIIDAFEYWGDNQNGEGYSIGEQEAAIRMINFIKRIAYHARTVRGQPNFLIVPQNGERILDYDTGIGYLSSDDFLDSIDGIGIEDLYYDETTAQPSSEVQERLFYLNLIDTDGKPVLSVDYVDDGSRPVRPVVTNFLSRSSADGWLPYAARTDRELDKINTFPGQP